MRLIENTGFHKEQCKVLNIYFRSTYQRLFRSHTHCDLSQAGSWRNAQRTLLPVYNSRVKNILYERVTAANLQKRMTSNDTEEPFKPFSSRLNDFVRESISENFAREGRDIDPCRLVFKNVTECLEIRVAPANNRMAKLKCRDISLQ
jgi:hypothetical protein